MDPFIFAVCEFPADDLPRLVYADWLDEHDDPDRAAFIRLQCELAALTDDSPRRREVAYLSRQLEDRPAADWAPPDWQVHDYRFARGFVEMVGLTAENLEHEHTAFLFGLNPIRRLLVSGMNGDVHCIRRCVPRTNTVTALDLTGNDLTADSLRDLAGFTQLAGVRELGLLFNRLDDEAAQVLCGEAFFQQLTLIRCGANPMTDAGRQRLRDHFGDRVTFDLERDPDRLYPLRDGELTTGFADAFTQVLVVEHGNHLGLAVFDFAGELIGADQQVVWEGGPRAYENYERAVVGWQAGLRPGTIRVKRFRTHEARTDGHVLEEFPAWYADWLEADVFVGSGFAEERVASWLAGGRFLYSFRGHDWSFDRTGSAVD